MEREPGYNKCTVPVHVTKAKWGISMDASLASWLDGVCQEWNLSRSEFVGLAVQTVREVVGAEIRMAESDVARAHHAIECFDAGEIPSRPDLEAFVRWWSQHREVAD